MLDKLVCRPATERDLPSILALYGQMHPQDVCVDLDLAKSAFNQIARYEGSSVYVGALDQTIVTTCTLIIVPNLTRGAKPYALIENVVTHKAHRGNGYGKAILAVAVTDAWTHDCYKVMLMTGSTCPHTLKFYSDSDFEQTKTGFQIRRLT